jgi:hypothetical protein
MSKLIVYFNGERAGVLEDGDSPVFTYDAEWLPRAFPPSRQLPLQLSICEILKQDSLVRACTLLAERQEILTAFDGSGMSAAMFAAMVVISSPIQIHFLDGLYSLRYL